MGASSAKLKRILSSASDETESEKSGKSSKALKLATPFVYTRKGSMYFDEDGDLAHEFYEEVKSSRWGVKTHMKRILTGLVPQGEVRLPFPCLHADFPIVMCQD